MMRDEGHADRSLRKSDLILAGAVIIGACLLWVALTLAKGQAADGSAVSIYTDNTLYGTYDLNTPQEIVLPEGHRVVIGNGEVRVTEAPCRDRICVRHAPVSVSGEEIICLPCRVRILVEGGPDGSYDTITQ